MEATLVFPSAGESMQDAVNRECLAVRNSVGILDASTLGKIDIQGRMRLNLLPACIPTPTLNWRRVNVATGLC